VAVVVIEVEEEQSRPRDHVVVACLCSVAVMAHLADAAESLLRPDPALMVAQRLAASATAEPTTTGGRASAEALAKRLANPIASLISVPFQSNFDFNAGQDNDKFKYTLNIQLVTPWSLSTDWNLITPIIQPVIYQDELFPGLGSKFGLGDMNPSFFFSPEEPFHGWIWGAGPVVLLPTATDNALGTGQWGAGPTAVGLRQVGPWT
jgi:4-amino-4-deoxy-L-arabinose transferase-like glycosyltransferase